MYLLSDIFLTGSQVIPCLLTCGLAQNSTDWVGLSLLISPQPCAHMPTSNTTTDQMQHTLLCFYYFLHILMGVAKIFIENIWINVYGLLTNVGKFNFVFL